MRLPSSKAVRAHLARLSLAEFVKQAWPLLEPDTPLIWNWHIDAMCEHVQALLEGRLAKRNLVMNVPPGSMKSTVVSVCAPAWRWIENPGWRGLFTSGSERVALRDSMKCRELLESSWYKDSFQPKWTLARDQNAKGFYRNSARGFRMAISAGSKIMGERANGIFVDDPNDPDEDSSAGREAIAYWWDNQASNRVADPRHGVRCLIQQRLAVDDLTGHVIGKAPHLWDHLVIRQEHDPSPDDRPTSLGWVDPRRVPGQLLFPERFTAEVVEAEKITLGSSGYAGQHQQQPFVPGGTIFKLAWFGRYRETPMFSRRLHSWDTGMKQSEANDPSVGGSWGEGNNGFYLLDVVRRRMGYPELKQTIMNMAERDNPHIILIEDKASGTPVIQDLLTTTRLPIIAYEPSGDKVMRAKAVSATVESGRVFLPEKAPWLMDYEAELAAFPKVAHDDQVDMTTQALDYFRSNGRINLKGIVGFGGGRAQL